MLTIQQLLAAKISQYGLSSIRVDSFNTQFEDGELAIFSDDETNMRYLIHIIHIELVQQLHDHAFTNGVYSEEYEKDTIDLTDLRDAIINLCNYEVTRDMGMETPTYVYYWPTIKYIDF